MKMDMRPWMIHVRAADFLVPPFNIYIHTSYSKHTFDIGQKNVGNKADYLL